MTARLKHFVDYARCIQPIRRMRQFYPPEKMPRFSAEEAAKMRLGSMHDWTGEIDWNRLEAHGERLWIASTECGLGFSGTGDFPHEWLRHGFGWNEPEGDPPPGWCPTCWGEEWGISPMDRDWAEPKLRAEFDAWSEVNEHKREKT